MGPSQRLRAGAGVGVGVGVPGARWAPACCAGFVGLGWAGGGVVLRCVAVDDCLPKLRPPPMRRASASNDARLPASITPTMARTPIRLAHDDESFLEATMRGSDIAKIPLKTVSWEH